MAPLEEISSCTSSSRSLFCPLSVNIFGAKEIAFYRVIPFSSILKFFVIFARTEVLICFCFHFCSQNIHSFYHAFISNRDFFCHLISLHQICGLVSLHYFQHYLCCTPPVCTKFEFLGVNWVHRIENIPLDGNPQFRFQHFAAVKWISKDRGD